MRRTMFGKSPERELLAPSRASIRDALLFDLSDQQASADLTLAERRVESWTFAPWLLLAGHLIMAGSLLVQDHPAASQGTLASVFVPLAIAIALDLVAGIVLLGWRRVQMAPHTVGRLMCGYMLAAGALWSTWSMASASLQLKDAAFLTLAMTTGFFVRSTVAIVSPPLAIINGVVALVATSLFAGSAPMTFAIGALATVMVVYSTANTRESLSRGRRRLAIEWQARKALNFVDEFENSGRGWFWETDLLGTLSYVSQQLADDFQCEPEALLGRQFTDLLSVDFGTLRSKRLSDSIFPRVFYSRTSWFGPPAKRTCTGRCRAIRSSMNAAASSAFAASGPISPSSASPNVRFRALPASIC